MDDIIENEHYINIQSFMTNKLGLSGNELIIYALIHGFSQDGISYFYGSLNYIMKTANVAKNTALNVLQNLVKKGLIVKREVKNYTVFEKEKKAQGAQHFCLYYTAASRNKKDNFSSSNSAPAESKNCTRASPNSAPAESKNCTRASPNSAPNNKFYNKKNISTGTKAPDEQQKEEETIVQELKNLFDGHFVFDNYFVPDLCKLLNEFSVDKSDIGEYLRFVFDKANEKKPVSLTNMFYKMAQSPVIMNDFCLERKDNQKKADLYAICPVCGSSANVYGSCAKCGFAMDDRNDDAKVYLHKQIFALPEIQRNAMEMEFNELISSRKTSSVLLALNPEEKNSFAKKISEIYSKYGIKEKEA